MQKCPAHSKGTTVQREAAVSTRAADVLSHAYHCVNYWFSITANLNGIICKCALMTAQESNIKASMIPLSDLVQLFWVTNNDLDSHLHLGLLQAEVQASNFGVGNTLDHACG